MTPSEAANRRLLRARDTIDREYAAQLDVPTLARIAHVSPSHFARSFRRTFGETPHRYVQRRRIERAMSLLRSTGLPVTEVALAVGFTSHGTFSRTFREVVGDSPSGYRRSGHAVGAAVCFQKAWLRPGVAGQESRFGEASPAGAA